MINPSLLGSLDKIELRDIWRTEAEEFKPWLALSDNLKILLERLQLDLELEAQERNAGPFRANEREPIAEEGPIE
jgi:hypothetical protein